MRAMYVYHVDTEIIHDVMDGVLYSVPPGEPYEFANPFIAKRFIEHKWFHGVVEIELERTRTGWVFKVEDAHRRATEALQAADEAYNQAYVETQQQDRLMQGKPAAPPSERQKRILKRQSVNLEEFGIRPIGTKSSQDKMLEAVMQQNQVMMSMFMAMMDGGDVKSALKSGMGHPVATPAPSDFPGTDYKVPHPMDFQAQSIPEYPDPPRRMPRMVNQGEDADLSDRANLGPEFDGDVDDPNSVAGPTVRTSDKPLNLNDTGLASALNLDEDRVKLKVPSPAKPKSKVNL